MDKALPVAFKIFLQDFDYIAIGNLIIQEIINLKHWAKFAVPEAMRSLKSNLLEPAGFFEVILNHPQGLLIPSRKTAAPHANGYIDAFFIHLFLQYYLIVLQGLTKLLNPFQLIVIAITSPDIFLLL